MPGLTQPHYEVEMRFSRQNVAASCILYYVTPGTVPTIEQMPGIADALYNHFGPQARGCIEPTTKLDGFAVVYRDSDLLLEATSTEDPAVGMAPAGDILPEEDAVVIQRRTGLPGRGKRGRIFMPFVPEGFALDSKLTPAGVTAYKALAARIQMPIAEIEGTTPILIPRQPSFKNNLLLPIVSARVLDNTCSRRDRRAPKRYFALGAAGNAG